MAGSTPRRGSGPLPRHGRGGGLLAGQALEGGRRQGRRSLPGLLPAGARPRGRDAPGQGVWRRRRARTGRVPLRLVSLLDPQDVPRARPQRHGRARHLRLASDLRRGAKPRGDLGPQLRVPVPDPLPAAERQLTGQRRVSAARIRAPALGAREGLGQGGHGRRAPALRGALQPVARPRARALRDQARDAVEDRRGGRLQPRRHREDDPGRRAHRAPRGVDPGAPRSRAEGRRSHAGGLRGCVLRAAADGSHPDDRSHLLRRRRRFPDRAPLAGRGRRHRR